MPRIGALPIYSTGHSKQLKLVGIDQRVEWSLAQEEGKSGAKSTAPCLTNRRMRVDPHIRWCEKGRLSANPYSIQCLSDPDLVFLI
jgi:hypothetical protein